MTLWAGIVPQWRPAGPDDISFRSSTTSLSHCHFLFYWQHYHTAPHDGWRECSGYLLFGGQGVKFHFGTTRQDYSAVISGEQIAVTVVCLGMADRKVPEG